LGGNIQLIIIVACIVLRYASATIGCLSARDRRTDVQMYRRRWRGNRSWEPDRKKHGARRRIEISRHGQM